MTFDLLSAIGFTLDAAIGVAVLSIGFGDTHARRIRLAVGLGLWFVAVALLAAAQVFHYQHSLGVPGLGLAVVLPIVVLAVLTLRQPALRRALDSVPLSLLIGVNVLRVVGVVFILLYFAGRLPAPFAPSAGWGDIITGVAAVPVAWLAHRYGLRARSAILAWNIFGLADLVAAIGLGVISSPGPLHLIAPDPGTAMMSTLPWMLIPAFHVPLHAATHLAVFYRLWNQFTAKQ
jgi:hypothetical protein